MRMRQFYSEYIIGYSVSKEILRAVDKVDMNKDRWGQDAVKVIKCTCTYRSCKMYELTVAIMQVFCLQYESQHTAVDTAFSFESFIHTVF